MPKPLNDLLRETSRSFYLTLRVLPAAVRPQIGLAYLLARATDTVADTEIIPVADRLEALQQLRKRILDNVAPRLAFQDLARHQGKPAERILLEKIETALAQLQTFSREDQTFIREVLVTITSGQELDLQRFATATADRIVALETADELDDYTYRVAGCVGEFWTKICRAHLFPNAKLNEHQLITDGIRFGKGLQMVNILRDLPADLKMGRCYLPTQFLAPAGLCYPDTILSPANEAKFLPLYRSQLDVAEGHLTAGWSYTNQLPYGQFRVRLACAWPVLIGQRTLAKLRLANSLDLAKRVKITRREVKQVLFQSLFACPFPPLWRKLYSNPANAIASGRDFP
jgi:farnesyl-diphosphate farnesyltransferase